MNSLLRKLLLAIVKDLWKVIAVSSTLGLEKCPGEGIEVSLRVCMYNVTTGYR